MKKISTQDISWQHFCNFLETHQKHLKSSDFLYRYHLVRNAANFLEPNLKVDNLTMDKFNEYFYSLMVVYNSIEKLNNQGVHNTTDANYLEVWRFWYIEEVIEHSDSMNYLIHLSSLLSLEEKDTQQYLNHLEKHYSEPAYLYYAGVNDFLHSLQQLKKNYPSIWNFEAEEDSNNIDGAVDSFSQKYSTIYQLMNLLADDNPQILNEYILFMNVNDFLLQVSYKLDKLELENKQLNS
jgi:hypothetical protein